jgi:hypothetical protein
MVIAAVPTVMLVLYVRIVQSQGNDPLVWVVSLLALAAVLALVSATPWANRSAAIIAAAAVPLFIVGVLGILSIGLPLVLAGSFAVAKAIRRQSSAST